MSEFPAIYTDAYGVEETIVHNDSTTLHIRLRGVLFEGSNFDSLEPVEDTPARKLSTFSLNQGDLCGCTLQCKIPVLLDDGETQRAAHIRMSLTLGEPAERGSLTEETLLLTLCDGDQRISGEGNSGWFEDELLQIQQQLPEGCFIRACINCQYSDYSPYGSSMFGSMMCFRNIKEEYSRTSSKFEFLQLQDRHQRLVQETYRCEEFARRIPGTGYRG